MDEGKEGKKLREFSFFHEENTTVMKKQHKLPRGKKIQYPPVRKSDVVDDFHGTLVRDPYRWMEDADDPETTGWVGAENEITSGFLGDVPEREDIRQRLTDLWDYPRYSVPHKKGGRYFFSKNEGLQNHSVFYVCETLDGEPNVVIDPNSFSEEGTIALTSFALSKDGSLLAYGLSSSGSDRQEIRVCEVDTGEDYDDLIKWCKFCTIAWKHDNSGFYYNRFPEPGTVPLKDENDHCRVYWHKLETLQSEDILVFDSPGDKQLASYPLITDDGKYLLLHLSHGTNPKNRIYYKEVYGDGEFIRLLDEENARYSFIDNIDTVFYFHTTLGASRGRVIAIDLKHPGIEDWEAIIHEREDVISSVKMVSDQFVVSYMHHAHHLLKLFDLDGNLTHEIELPGIGTITDLSGKREEREMFIAFTSFLFAPCIYRYDFGTDHLSPYRCSEVDFDPSQYETEQVFYESKGGTQIPMFITCKKGLHLDSSTPTLLCGYGGFNVGMMPRFSVSELIWLEQGGAYAVANLRGGNEYGEEWHLNGMLDKKQNVFDDFIAAAEWLIDNDYTRPSKLAIQGGSNGGLLVAACMLQRPELYGAVICQVPVTDMLRYHKFTVGRYWTPEYGNPEESPEHFKFLYAYSPLHNIQEGVEYPPILVTTADTDDRVVPSHSKKFVATLQEKTSGRNPILIRVETKAGHGAGKPTTKIIDEQTDIYAFLFKILGIEMQLDKEQQNRE